MFWLMLGCATEAGGGVGWLADVKASSSATAVTVCSDGDYPTIQEGIDSVPAGSRIDICPGVWSECLTLSGEVTLMGAGGTVGTTLEPGAACRGVPVKVTGGATTLVRLTLADGSVGVSAENADLTLRRVRVTGMTGMGIYIRGGNLVVEDAVFAANDADVRMWVQDSDATITRAIFRDDQGLLDINSYDSTTRIYNAGFLGSNTDKISIFTTSGPSELGVYNSTFRLSGEEVGLRQDLGEGTAVNNLFLGDGGGYGFFGEVSLSYNDFWNLTDAGFNSEGGRIGCDQASLDAWTYSENNYVFDPVPVFPDASPAIDAGDPDPIYNDVDGTRSDLGRLGGPYARPAR